MRSTVFLLFVLGAACGPETGAAPGRIESGNTPGYPRTATFPHGSEVSLETRPVRILPCNASAVDFLVELVDPSRVVALPNTVRGFASLEEAPPGWRALPEMPDLETETVLSRQPDLVIAHAWQDVSAIEAIRRAGVAVLRVPGIEDYEGLRQLVRGLGHLLDAEDRAERLLERCDERVSALAGDASRSELTAMSYSNYGTGGWTAGAKTTIDVVIAVAGLRNAASSAGIEGHSRVDIEDLLRIDPDLLILTETEGTNPTLDLLRSDPRLSRLAAVRKGRLVTLAGRLVLSDSHRIVDAAEALSREVDSALGRLPDGDPEPGAAPRTSAGGDDSGRRGASGGR